MTNRIGGGGGDSLVNSSRRNGQIDRVEIRDGTTVDFGVPVPDGKSLTVYRWGCWRQDDTTPTGLDVVLMDQSRTVQQSVSTDDSGETTVTFTNTSGTLAHYYLGIRNSTGTDLLASDDKWVTGFFVYEVSDD